MPIAGMGGAFIIGCANSTCITIVLPEYADQHSRGALCTTIEESMHRLEIVQLQNLQLQWSLFRLF